MTKILYLVTEDWFFASHFLPMARAARAAGMEVVVAARARGHAAGLADEGGRLVRPGGGRRTVGPLTATRTVIEARRIVRAERPDIVHCIAVGPVGLGGLAARLEGK